MKAPMVYIFPGAMVSLGIQVIDPLDAATFTFMEVDCPLVGRFNVRFPRCLAVT